MDVKTFGYFPDLKIKYVFTVIYCNPCNNYNAFLNSSEQNMQSLEEKGTKVMIIGDLNINLTTYFNYVSNYCLSLQSNSLLSLIT